MAKNYTGPEREEKTEEQLKAERDNRANQLNPNNAAYWSSRGINRR